MVPRCGVEESDICKGQATAQCGRFGWTSQLLLSFAVYLQYSWAGCLPNASTGAGGLELPVSLPFSALTVYTLYIPAKNSPKPL